MLDTLPEKVYTLLAFSMFIGAFGTYCGRNLESIGSLIGLGISFLVGSIALYICADMLGTTLGIAALFAWVFVSGLFMGPVINSFGRELGWRVVAMFYCLTAFIMVVCGAVGMFSGINFGPLGIVLFVALSGLIVASIVGMFIGMSRKMDIVFSGLGCIVFSAYFVFDFWRLGHTENTWGNAIRLTEHIYLDFINLLIRLLELYAALKHK